MSGPIIRKYGFPNFDKIFGDRPLEHGVDDQGTEPEPVEQAGSADSAQKAPAKKKGTKPKKA